eukprot:EG_transcript_16086
MPHGPLLLTALLCLLLADSIRATANTTADAPDTPDDTFRPPDVPEGRLFFFTIASRHYGWYCDMLQSALYNNITMHIYGFRDRSLTRKTKVAKIDIILQALQTLPPKTVAVMVDAFDVLFARGEAPMMEAYRRLNADVVVGCEKMCYNEILADCGKEFPIQPSGYRGLNSGGMIGTVEGLIDLYKRSKAFRARNPRKTEGQKMSTDQGFVGQAFLEAQRAGSSIVLDCNETIIQNMYSAAADFCDPESLRNCVTGTHPSIFHFNGQPMKQKPIPNWRWRFWWNKQPPSTVNASLWLNGSYKGLLDVCRRHNGDFVRYWS